MAGTEVAVGYVSILPKMGSGFTRTVESALSASGASGAKSFSASFTGGIGAAGVAAGNLITGAISTAMGAVTSSLDSAVSRVDTLNQFPKVMSNLGFSTEDADAALSKLSDGIQGLPTALDEIVGNAQTLSLTLGDLGRGTDVALALNDGMLTYGASAEYVNNAVFQLNQMISAGSYDMQSWRSVMESAPGYLDQVAEACLGAGSGANDLRVALNEGTVTTDQFLSAVVALDQEGGEGVVAFSEQAKSATGGIATSFANVGTAVTRNLANFIDAVNGEDGRIAAFADSLKQVVNDIGAAVLPLGEALGGAFASFTDGFDAAYSSLSSALGGLGGALFGTDAVVEEFEEIAGATGDASQSADELLGQYQELFDQVWNGDWGDGEEARRQAFVDAGYSAEQYDAVQQLVNEHGADYVLTMEDLESVLGDVASSTGKAETATRKVERTVKEATKGALTPYIDGLKGMVFGIDETSDAFDEFGAKVGTVTTHTDGLADDLSQFWGRLAESLGSGAGLGESLSVAVDFAFDFPADVQSSIDDACSKLDSLAGKAKDAAAAVAPSAAKAWESFTGCLTTLAGTAFDSALSFFSQVEGPLEGVVGALGDLASDELGDASKVFDAIAENAPAIGETFTDSLATVFSNVAGALTAMGPAVGALTGFITDSFVALVGGFADSCAALAKPLEDASGALKSVAEDYGPKFAEFFDGLDVEAVAGPLSDLASTLRDGVGGVIKTMADETLPDFQEAWETVAEYFSSDEYEGANWLESLGNVAETAFGTICIAAETAMEVVGSLALALSRFFTGDWAGAAEAIGEGLSSVVDGACEEVDYLFGTDLTGWIQWLNGELAGTASGLVTLDADFSGFSEDLGNVEAYSQFSALATDLGASAEAMGALGAAMEGGAWSSLSLGASDVLAFNAALEQMRESGAAEQADRLAQAFGITEQAVQDATTAVEALGTTATDTQQLADSMSKVSDATGGMGDAATEVSDLGGKLSDAAAGAQDATSALGSVRDAAADTQLDVTADQAKQLIDNLNETGSVADVALVKVQDGATVAEEHMADLDGGAASVNSQFDGMASRLDGVNGKLQTLVSYNGAVITLNIVESTTSTGASSSSSGSSVTAHATGGVTNGVHIIGEAGPEAIVPLYAGAMDPFARQVSDFIEKDLGGGGSVYNVYVNDARINDDEAIRSNVAGLLWDLDRLGAI